MTIIKQEDLIHSVADALQFISYYHPLDFIRAMRKAWEMEQSPAAKAALTQMALDDDLVGRIKQTIRTNTTPRHVRAKIIQVPDIPRTISGKIVELAVTNIIHKRPVKNRDALANPEALESFRKLEELTSLSAPTNLIADEMARDLFRKQDSEEQAA